jgi:LAO/AO transport system kinase
MTLVERAGTELLPILLGSQVTRPSFRVGITGPPGAGKSTLISQLLQQLRKAKKSVAVLAVDPSSPFSNGAILGDRIRYTDFSTDKEVFVRSLGTRGSLGGLSAAAYPMLRALDLCEFDVVIVETVGVGQTELEVMNVADRVVVVLVPESGDSIQAMKAGLIEIADLFVVNKSDRPGADVLAREIESAGLLAEPPITIPVIKASAKDGTGTDEIFSWILDQMKSIDLVTERTTKESLQSEARALLRMQFEKHISKLVSGIENEEDLVAAFDVD